MDNTEQMGFHERRNIEITEAHRERSLSNRLAEIVKKETKPSRRNAEMAEKTGTHPSQWASWKAGRAKPSADLLVGTCIAFPHYSLWLMTGVEDEAAGQVSPETATEKRQKPAERLLMRLTELAAAYSEKGGDWGIDYNEWEAEELNVLHKIRNRELLRRLTNEHKKD